MTAEEVFYDLNHRYGDDFNWHMLPYSNKTFVTELKKELGKDHFLYHKQMWAVAKCDSNDDVLYVTDGDSGTDIYYIIHLTYSALNKNELPKFKEFSGILTVKEYIEQSYTTNYL